MTRSHIIVHASSLLRHYKTGTQLSKSVCAMSNPLLPWPEVVWGAGGAVSGAGSVKKISSLPAEAKSKTYVYFGKHF